MTLPSGSSTEMASKDQEQTRSQAQAPPPTYAPTQPQIMVAPLPDAASFFWGRTIQGEVFVKGLGEGKRENTVKQLSVELTLSDHLPHHPPVNIHSFPLQILYPRRSSVSGSTSSPAPIPQLPFSAINRFSVPLPIAADLPGTLNLTTYNRGEVKYELTVRLTLASGSVIVETIRIEGTPPVVRPGESYMSSTTGNGALQGMGEEDGEPKEVEKVLEKEGVRTRILLDTARPRLGTLLRLGVEIRPIVSEKAMLATPGAGPSTRPNVAAVLRPLRRVTVHLFRRVKLQGSLTTSTPQDQQAQHLSLVYASGKSMRYPGTSSSHPPLRLLFTVPTAQLASSLDQTSGEITQTTPYHSVSFFVRVVIGFGENNAAPHGATSRDGQRLAQSQAVDSGNWTIEREVEIRPKIWREPSAVVIEMGEMPSSGEGVDGPGTAGEDDSVGPSGSKMTDEELAREAYRLKGRDVVGSSGTIRLDPGPGAGDDLPPPFEIPDDGPGVPSSLGDDEAGPSGSTSRNDMEGEGGGPPSFLESEAQMRSGEAPVPRNAVPSQRLVPVNFEDGEDFDRTTMVGRRGSLGGELGTWVEYDGYETFSVAPPSMSASFGVGGSMDPPQEGDEDVNVVGGIMGRLGLEAGHHRDQSGREFIESLGLGEGTRVVDLPDDLPPDIDEPSLPALPDFTAHQHHQTHHPQTYTHQPLQRSPVLAQGNEVDHHPTSDAGDMRNATGLGDNPPSFDASEAAVERQRRASQSVVLPTTEGMAQAPPPSGHGHGHGHGQGHGPGEGDAPPGYFGNPTQGGGPPAYS